MYRITSVSPVKQVIAARNRTSRSNAQRADGAQNDLWPVNSVNRDTTVPRNLARQHLRDTSVLLEPTAFPEKANNCAPKVLTGRSRAALALSKRASCVRQVNIVMRVQQ